jgi:hypothetical protein
LRIDGQDSLFERDILSGHELGIRGFRWGFNIAKRKSYLFLKGPVSRRMAQARLLSFRTSTGNQPATFSALILRSLATTEERYFDACFLHVSFTVLSASTFSGGRNVEASKRICGEIEIP